MTPMPGSLPEKKWGRGKRELPPFLFLLLASCATEPLPSPGWRDEPPEIVSLTHASGKLRAGAARVPVDPPFAAPMAGYVGASWFLLRELRDPLYARALVIERGDFRVALVSVDRVLVPPALRQAVEARADFRSAAIDAWIVGATHAHTAPGGYLEAWPAELFGMGDYDPLLLDHLAEGVSQAVADAAARLEGAAVEAGSTEIAPEEASLVSFNRRDPSGHADATLDLLRITAGGAEKRTIARLARFAAHPTILPFYLRRSSGDYPGVLCRSLEESDGGVCLFAQGPSADLAAGAPEDTPVVGWERRVERLGRCLAAAARHLEGSLKAQERDAPLVHLQAMVRLPPREPWKVPFVGRDMASKYPEHAFIQCLRLGDALLITFPGEMEHALGERIAEEARRAAGARQVIVWTLADHYLGYVFTRETFEKGGKSQHLTAYGPELSGLLEDRMVGLAERCWQAGEAPVLPQTKQGD